MGIRSGATNKLEQAMAAAFATYFVGDPSFVKTDGVPMFVAAQAVTKMAFPQVCFLCLEAEEQIAQSAVFMGSLHLIVDTALNERADDYTSLLALHDDRVNKCINFISRPTVNSPPQSAPIFAVINAPASGPDKRTVTGFQLYGIGNIHKESNTKEANRLCYIAQIEVGFQPI